MALYTFIKKKAIPQIEQYSSRTPAQEWERFEIACEKANQVLLELYEKALAEMGEENAAIFEIHRMMLEDEDFLDAIKEMLKNQSSTAEFAVSMVGERFSATFAAMDDEYMQARASDVKDVSGRVVGILTGQQQETILLLQPAILVADDLTPSQTIQLDRSRVLGFLTRHGSSNSHTAILARTMNIPALVGVDFDDSWDGKLAVLDGYDHCVYIDPTPERLSEMQERRKKDLEQLAFLQALRGKQNRTLDGREIKVYANIGDTQDVELVLQCDAQGIGLFRSEFLYLNAQDWPTEEQQFLYYQHVIKAMEGKKVIIRTLDIGADKQADYFRLDKEDNPALGYRAIRVCLTREEIFRQQLRAILRASAFGNVSVMFPMIISVWELERAKAILEGCKTELHKQGIAIGALEIGIMVETPAAVIIADELAAQVDFLSIGTNDLTQYTLAIDRQNPRLDRFYDPQHPAVLRMIRHVVEAGHRHNCWVGICGELGAEQTLTETFLRMGLDELSVAPSAVLPLRRLICSLDLSKKQ